MSTILDSNDDEVTARSITECLELARVIKIGRLSDGLFEISEGCDEHYSAKLTPDQMRLLAQELIAMADSESQAVKPPSQAP